MRTMLTLMVLFMAVTGPVTAQNFVTDRFDTGKENPELEITFIGHGTLMCRWGDLIVHVDPVSREADYTTLPDADVIVITHEHGDHLDAGAIAHIEKENTVIFLTKTCRKKLDRGTVIKNGDTRKSRGIVIEAVPAYNIKHLRSGGSPYHPKGGATDM